MLLLGGDTSKKERVFWIGGEERRTTDESTPLDIETWDLRVELEDTEITSWSVFLFVAFFRPSGVAVFIGAMLCAGWDDDGPLPPPLVLLSLRGKKFVSF
jgi:hypothetical protein